MKIPDEFHEASGQSLQYPYKKGWTSSSHQLEMVSTAVAYFGQLRPTALARLAERPGP